ncbi:MAG: heme ABC exporter ATP-binding protein CcmA [Armatimonadota bacterium]|nr:heme ABC exporter ATP-binding protein CcmA [Armatimonadota bacterium]MDR5702834.1 heme ABC exporter ATP-binding protein CcmA [Armatimonadota bacterium]MDR7435665.1 heme ABC exporter ATP-binding protein CcmA [Armatimonadota bacterium]
MVQEDRRAVEARGVKKAFGRTWALRGVDLEVRPGEYLALLGPNGSGKTTLLRILATLIRPTEGNIRIFGRDPRREGEECRRLLGFVGHDSFLYGSLSVSENLHFYARLFGLPDIPARTRQVLEALGLERRAHDLVRTLSRGLQQRVAIARALLHDPILLLLDEPFTGLDAQASRSLGELLASLRQEGRAIIMATHNLNEGLEACDRAVILLDGRVARVMEGPEIRGERLREAFLATLES